MFVKRWMIALAAAACLSACNVSVQTGPKPAANTGTPEQQAVAAKAGNAFLAQVDAGQFEATWDNVSPHLRAMATEADWTSTLGVMRRSVGAVKSRKGAGFGFTHHLDGVPEGDYVAVGYATAFENATLQEKVVMHLDHGQWKVLGYFLTKPFVIGNAGG